MTLFVCVYVCVFMCVQVTPSNVELRNYVISRQFVIERRVTLSRQHFIKYPPKPPWGWVGQLFLGKSQSLIYPHMRAKFGRGPTVGSKKGGGYDYETCTSMSGTILPTMCQL